MELITSKTLESIIVEQKKKSEGLLPELVKRLILSSCPDVSNIRIPGMDDIWAPGFDGTVINKEEFKYVSSGQSVWEFGTNADSLEKINSDYKKRTDNPLGFDKADTTFYIVIPKIWAYKSSIPEWENGHKRDWKNIHVYDASVLCDWINSEPVVCAWLFEVYFEERKLDFSSVDCAWQKLANRTMPSFSRTIFTEGRDEQIELYLNTANKKICRVKAETMVDAYGFCLSSLLRDPIKANTVIVVYNEDTYRCLTRIVQEKTFLLHFPFSGHVSDDNSAILCFSKEAVSLTDAIMLQPLWKTQLVKAMCDMNIPDYQASELYAFTHGNLLSLIRRIPGNSAENRPKWASVESIDLLKPMVFLRHYCVSSEEDQQLVARLAGVDYPTVERKYKELLRMEDAPIKAVEDRYVIVNYEEAWMTLNIDISDVLSTRLYEEVISLLSRAGGSKNIDTQQLKARIHQLLYNYIYFAETGSDGVIIQTQIKNILKYTHCPGCADILLGELSNLSEAAPAAALEFIEDEVKSGIVYDVFKGSGLLYQYRNILFALDQLVMANDTSVRACQVLYELCTVEREYVDLNSPKESLLNALCLWDDQTALTLDEKKILTKKFIRVNSNFGVPFAIGLISKDTLLRGKRIGEKEPEPKAFSHNDFLAAYNEIAMLVFDVAVRDRRLDWIGKLLESYWRLSCKTISDAAKKFDGTSYPPGELLSLHFQLRNEVFSINDYNWEDREAWIAPLNEWVKCTSSDDRVGKIGWMFYKYYETPFEELLSLPAEQFDARTKRAKEIRGEYFIKIKEEFGIEVASQFAHYMEDDPLWGSFLSGNVEDKEYQVVVQEVYQLQKTSFLSGLLNSGNLNSATEAFMNLPENVQESILPKITRIDITAWLTSPKRERIYWESKTMLEYNEQVYWNLLRYNPCGLLHFLYWSLKDISNILDKIFEVFAAIADGSNCNNTDLIPSIILKVDEQHYSDKWAQLCLTLYNKGLLKSIYGYYPQCLRKYFFGYPSKMCDMFLSDKGNFGKHFYYDFYLPTEAYEDYGQFKLWADYLYEKAADNASLLSYIGYILGRSVTGQDGIFPHEFVRMILEEYRNDKLTLNVAYGKINSSGVRTAEDGAKEQGMAEKYRVNARTLEIDFPQTARILRKIADSFESDAKRDRLQSEIEPLF